MLPDLKREQVQFISSTLIVLSIFFMTVTIYTIVGVALVGVSCWVMLISESILLNRVQSEMSTALESLRKKQEIEVKDLLFYLRQSELGNSPWSNVEAAKNHIAKLGLPAIITDAGGACVALNPALTETLGYDKDFIGKLCHGVTRTDIYGEYVQGISANVTSGKRFMHSRIVMLDTNGDEHDGTVAIILLADMRTVVGIWLPDDFGILKNI
jgi:hypothetical protein